MREVSDLYERGRDGVVLHVHLQPGAGRSAVVGRHGAALKVRVAAPPVDGRANDAAAAVLAEAFGLAARDVVLIAGATSRVKRFRLVGADPDDVATRLRVLVAEDRPGVS